MDISRLLAERKGAEVVSVRPDATLRETARTLLTHKIGAALVINADNALVGIVSERDLVPVIANHSPELVEAPVSSVMTASVITCTPDDEIAYVLHLMKSHGIRHMPVVSDGTILGMLSIRVLTTAYEHLRIEANTDPLTEVSNRRPFLKTLREEFEHADQAGEPMSVAMMDIDHFKRVNDTYGHEVGDRVLRTVSGMLIAEFRTIDLVGRMGGEEFAFLFPKTNLDGSRTACERLLDNIRKAEIAVSGETIKITVSIGLASKTADTPIGTAILKRADALLYEAKKGGRDKLVVDAA